MYGSNTEKTFPTCAAQNNCHGNAGYPGTGAKFLVYDHTFYYYKHLKLVDIFVVNI